jgi:type IV secretion system protein VirD4
VASRAQKLYSLPKTVGEKRTHPLAFVVFAVLMLAASSVATQVFAYRLHFNSALGQPIAHLNYPYAKALYWPLAWVSWAWKFGSPLSRLEYPQSVHDALIALFCWLGGGFVVAIVGTLAVSFALRPVTKVDELVDSARWADRKDLEREGLLDSKAGPIIGGFETKRGIVPLRYSGELGISYTGPPGDGKSALLKTSLLIPLCHEEADTWTADERRAHPWGEEPSIVALDVKGNLVASTSRYQSEMLGKEVFILEPLASETDGLAKLNPLWGIHLGTDREADDCYQASLDIVDMDGKGLPTYWDKASTAFGGAAIAKIGYRSLYLNDPKLLSLPGLVDYISSKATIDELIDDMLATPDDPHAVFGWVGFDGKPTRVRPWIADVARAMKAKAEEEKSGVYGSFIEFLAIYRSEVLRKHITESTFSFKQLANGSRAGIVYINVPAMRLDHLRPYLRMLTRSALRELTESTGTIEGREVRGNVRSTVFALDEVAALKHVEELGSASGFLRGHGVILMLFWQAISQLHRLYGAEESIRETIDVHIFGRPKTHEAAKLISDALGQFSALVTKRNVSGRRVTVGPRDHLAEHADITTRSLLTPSEVMRLPKERAIVFTGGLRINTRKFSYYLHPWLKQRAGMGAVERSDVMQNRPLFMQNLEKELGLPNVVKLLQPMPGPAKAAKATADPERVSIPRTENPIDGFQMAMDAR